MSVQHAPTEMTESHERHSYARVPRRWIVLARVGWVILVGLNLGVCVASLPVYVALLQIICPGAVIACPAGELAPATVRALQAVGLSLGGYAVFELALTAVISMVCFALSAVLFWRKSDDWMALLVAFFLTLMGTAGVIITVSQSPSVWQLPAQVSIVLLYVLLFLIFYMFPDGHFVPGWTRWLMVGTVSGLVYIFWPTAFVTISWLKALLLPWTALFYLSLVVAMVYRYRHASSAVQRQQTKWVVSGFAIALAGFFGAILWNNLVFFPTSELIGDTVTSFALLLIPLSFGIAVLHFRLWDIDVLINRTLVYGTLTVMLALVYFGLVIGLQALVRLFTGQVSQSPVVIVASTLAIAALFQLLRRRLQAIIDRRFYRRKYDAAKTLADFSATLRNEVDLNQLSEHLIAVVQETMQPAHVSLWLRPPEHDGKQRAPWRATPPGSSEGE